MKLFRFSPFALALVALAGCSSDPTKQMISDMNKSNIQRLANMYSGIQNTNSGKGPKDEAELRKFISETPKDRLELIGINPDKVDEVFTSERDKKPFKIRYGVGGGRGSVDAVIFESEGVSGKKQVGYTGGKVEDVDDATYKTLWEGKKPATTDAPAAGGRSGAGTGRPPGAPTGPTG
jgi:hypothetical protein